MEQTITKLLIMVEVEGTTCGIKLSDEALPKMLQRIAELSPDQNLVVYPMPNQSAFEDVMRKSAAPVAADAGKAVEVDGTIFPDTDYAHCLHCGDFRCLSVETDGRYRFVQCGCGARGPGVGRSGNEVNGMLDLDVADNAARRAWNTRVGSNGRAEIEARLREVYERLDQHAEAGTKPHAGLIRAKDKWEGLLAQLS